MDTLNSNPAETLAPVENIASAVPETSTPEAIATPVAKAALSPEALAQGSPVAPVATPAPAAAPAPAPVATIKLPLPQTDGHTVGGWNRFAGYNPNAAKNKPKDGRGGSGRK